MVVTLRIFRADRNGLLWLRRWSSPSTPPRVPPARVGYPQWSLGEHLLEEATASSVTVGSEWSPRASSADSSMCWVPQLMREVSISSPCSP